MRDILYMFVMIWCYIGIFLASIIGLIVLREHHKNGFVFWVKWDNEDRELDFTLGLIIMFFATWIAWPFVMFKFAQGLNK